MTSEARLFLNLLTMAVMFSVLGAAWAYAWFRGRRPERYGATLYTACFIIMIVIETVTGERIPAVPTLFLDTGIAAAFLAFAVIYNSLWQGAALILQGIGLGLHAMHLTGSETVQPGQVDYYALGNNLVSVGILLTFVFGTWAARRAMRRKIRQATMDGMSLSAG